MNASLLPWLSNQKFIPLVEDVLKSGFEATIKADKELGRNVIDPFLMLFEMGNRYAQKMAGLGRRQISGLRLHRHTLHDL